MEKCICVYTDIAPIFQRWLGAPMVRFVKDEIFNMFHFPQCIPQLLCGINFKTTSSNSFSQRTLQIVTLLHSTSKKITNV